MIKTEMQWGFFWGGGVLTWCLANTSHKPPCTHGGQFRRSSWKILKSFRYGYARKRQESVRHLICYSADQINESEVDG
jgi:hypothetical protein